MVHDACGRRETVKTVGEQEGSPFTQLKQGVNENRAKVYNLVGAFPAGGLTIFVPWPKFALRVHRDGAGDECVEFCRCCGWPSAQPRSGDVQVSGFDFVLPNLRFALAIPLIVPRLFAPQAPVP
jgi:hypothetical protein